jgi:transposase
VTATRPSCSHRDLRDWLPADHLAWFVLDVVDHLDLGPFLKAYRADGHGRAAYAPRMLLAVLLYAYCSGIRSSRQIERRCHEDIAFRVLAGNRTPDHVTIARSGFATSKPWPACWSSP